MSQDHGHQVLIGDEVYRQWCHLGRKQGLDTDSKIALFLLQHYEKSSVHNKSEECCISCQRVLPRVCNICSPSQSPHKDNELQQHYLQDVQKQQLLSKLKHNVTQENRSSPSTSQNITRPQSVIQGPHSSVFVHSGSVLSAGNLSQTADDKLFFTNLYPVTEHEIQAGKFSVIGQVKQEPTSSQTNSSPCSTQLSHSQCDVGTDHSDHYVSTIEPTGDSHPVRIFQISDIGKVAVDAVFTNCVRKVQPISQPIEQGVDAEVKDHSSTSSPREEENRAMNRGFDETVMEEEGLPVSDEHLPMVDEQLTDKPLTDRELELTESTEQKPQLPPPSQNKRPRNSSTRKTWGRPPYLCQKCGASFKSTSSLTRHILKHTGERPFPCSECSAAFATRPELTVHFRKHTGEKPFLCPVCGSAYDRSSNLHTHLRTHTGERPFKCDQCGAGFTTSSSLTRHKRIHTGEKPYVCTQCGAAFPQLGHLKEHIHRHTGIKPHRCQHCDAAFSTMSRLRRHQQKVQCTKR